MKSYNISPDSMLFKGLNLLERLYFNYIPLTNVENGCPIFWKSLVMILFAPFYIFFIPIVSIFEQISEEDEENEGFTLRLILKFLAAVGLFVIILFIIPIVTSTDIFLLELFFGLIVVFTTVMLLIMIIIFLMCLFVRIMDKYNEKRAKQYPDSTNIGVIKYISLGVNSFYNKNCPKITWNKTDNDEV